MTRTSVFIWSTIYVILAAFAFEYLGKVVGNSMSESINEPVIVMASLMLPICLVAPLFIPLPDVIDRFKFILSLFGLGVWGYFTYQYMLYENYTLAEIPSDIKFGLSWLVDNRNKVVLFVACFIGITLIKRSVAVSTRTLSDHIDDSLTGGTDLSDNGRS